MKKKVTLKTRPFQPFLWGARDLLNLAKPYYDRIEQDRIRYESTGVVTNLPAELWQTEKSLSIGSFMLKYAGLEALVNCVYDDFKSRELDSLPDEYFVGPLLKNRTKLRGNAFPNWHLPTRVFLVVPLCSDPTVDPRTVFDTDLDEWKRFDEVVKIRHSFSHAVSEQPQLELIKAAPKLWLANDQHPDNFWPLTNVPKDHRILNYQAANDLNSIIDAVITKLRSALPIQLNESYMTEEQGKVSDI